MQASSKSIIEFTAKTSVIIGFTDKNILSCQKSLKKIFSNVGEGSINLPRQVSLENFQKFLHAADDFIDVFAFQFLSH
jgi:hypothetical protein